MSSSTTTDNLALRWPALDRRASEAENAAREGFEATVRDGGDAVAAWVAFRTAEVRYCTFKLEPRPGLSLGGTCGHLVQLDGRLCYWHEKVRNGVPVAEVSDGADWTPAVNILKAEGDNR